MARGFSNLRSFIALAVLAITLQTTACGARISSPTSGDGVLPAAPATHPHMFGLVRPQQPLTDAQMLRLKTVLSGMNAWNDIIKNQLNPQSPGATPPAGTTPTTGPASLDQDCSINVSPPAQKGTLQVGDGNTKIDKFTVDIKGDHCPLKLYAAVDGTQLSDGLTAKMVINGQMLSDDYKKMYDIDSYNLTMDIDAKLVKSASGSVVMNMTIKSDGTSHSQAEGNVGQGFDVTFAMNMTPPPQGQQGLPDFQFAVSEDLLYNFSDVDADLKSVVKMLGLFGPTDEKYYINDQPVAKDVYEALRNLISLPTDKGGQNPSQPPGPTPVSGAKPMSCEVTLYNAADVSRDALLTAIHQKATLTATPLLHDQKCSQNGVWSVPVNTDVVDMDLVYQPQEIDLNVSVNHSQTNYLTFLADEGGDSADQVGAFTFRLNCQVVPKCQ